MNVLGLSRIWGLRSGPSDWVWGLGFRVKGLGVSGFRGLSFREATLLFSLSGLSGWMLRGIGLEGT